jgi:hypothetical protein
MIDASLCSPFGWHLQFSLLLHSYLIRIEPEGSESGAGGFIVHVKDAANPHVFRDLDKHRCVINKDRLGYSRLGDVKSEPKDSNVRLAHVNEAGRDKRVNKLVELKLSDAISIHFTRLIANDNNLEAIPGL